MTFKQFAETLDKLDTEDLIEETRKRKSKSKRRNLRRFRNIAPKSIFLPSLMNMPTPRQELIQGKQRSQKQVVQPVSNGVAKGGAKPVQKILPPPPKPFRTSPTLRTITPKRPRPLRGSPEEARLAQTIRP